MYLLMPTGTGGVTTRIIPLGKRDTNRVAQTEPRIAVKAPASFDPLYFLISLCILHFVLRRLLALIPEIDSEF